MREILRYLAAMLPSMLLAAPAVAVARALRLRALGKAGGSTVLHEVGVAVFALFLVGLFSQTVLPRLEISGTGIAFLRPAGGIRLNLLPGRVFFETATAVFVQGYPRYFLINFLGNIGIFMPVGFSLPLLWRRWGLGRTALAGFLLSFFIELCQLPLRRGCDVDDLWLNTLGAVAGYGIWRLASQWAPRLSARFRVPGGGEGQQPAVENGDTTGSCVFPAQKPPKRPVRTGAVIAGRRRRR